MCRGARPGRLGHSFPCPTPAPRHACCLPRRPLRYPLSPLPPAVPTLCGFIASLRAQNLPRAQADEHAFLLESPWNRSCGAASPVFSWNCLWGAFSFTDSPLSFLHAPFWEDSSVLLCWHFHRQVRGTVDAQLCLDSCPWRGLLPEPASWEEDLALYKELACGAPRLGYEDGHRAVAEVGVQGTGGVQGPFCLKPSVIPLQWC